MSARRLLQLISCLGLLAGTLLIGRPNGELLGFSTRQLQHAPVHSFMLPGVVIFVAYGVVPLILSSCVTKGRRFYRPYAALALLWLVLDMSVFKVFNWLQLVFAGLLTIALVAARKPL